MRVAGIWYRQHTPFPSNKINQNFNISIAKCCLIVLPPHYALLCGYLYYFRIIKPVLFTICLIRIWFFLTKMVFIVTSTFYPKLVHVLAYSLNRVSELRFRLMLVMLATFGTIWHSPASSRFNMHLHALSHTIPHHGRADYVPPSPIYHHSVHSCAIFHKCHIILHHHALSGIIHYHPAPSRTILHHQEPSCAIILHHFTPSDTLLHHLVSTQITLHHPVSFGAISHYPAPSTNQSINQSRRTSMAPYVAEPFVGAVVPV